MENMRIIIAGGGTGGHIFPAIAIANAIKRINPMAKILFVGAIGKMEMEKVPQEGYEIVGLDIAGFNRSNIWKNFSLPFKLLKSLWKAKSIIRSFNPNVVVGVGGYASFPMLREAQKAMVPTLIQEQNSFAGKSNQILAKHAKAVCVAYEKMDQFFPSKKIVLTGNPVRAAIAHSKASRSDGQLWLNMNPEKKTLLVVGGSLGAKSINEAIDKHLEELTNDGIQIVWQTGKPYHSVANQRATNNGAVKVFDFIREMDLAYAAADVVVSRAGALAIAELCIVAKPVVFVPYPYAAEDHQTSNAAALVMHNAAEMVRDSDVMEELIPKVKLLFKDELAQSVMKRNLKSMAITDADDRIANRVLNIAKEKTS
ncbi:MAG: undecaprenyldiphospho-muramoylpentapeptide beta-N-acetylglucosaminyltransferase [Bacteroidetes bacterium]|nr:undecaprenyldiphospho-muramoylpentapeptide beta-N-acetylglucosaminyltransferase [Bacteroidota bacterium]